jgi:hypothetical protein
MPVTFDNFNVPTFTPAPVVNMEEFQQMARRVADIEELLTRHVGPVYGGTQNNPHPRQQRFYREVHGPLRQSIDNTHSVTFTVDYDSLATQLYQAKLTFRLAAVRANLSTAASGGGQTSGSSSASSSGSSSASTAGTDATTSSASSASSSSTDAPSSSSDGVHHHTVGEYYSDPGLATEAAGTGASGAGSNHNHTSATTDSTTSAEPDTGHTHVVTGNTSIESAHTHTGPSHTHGLHDVRYYTVGSAKVLGMFLASGASTTDFTTFTAASAHTHTSSHSHTIAHTHTISHSHTIAHTHTIAHDHSVAAHTHSLTFTAIQEGSAPSTPGVTITINGTDRTTALGGPWNASQSNLDVTAYLRATSGEPLRGDNTFVFTSTELLDIEIVLKSFIGSSDPWSAGIAST